MINKYEKIVKPRLDVIGAWKRRGLSNEEIAKKLSIARSTFQKYANDYPELSDCLKNNREEADAFTENTTYKMANGYTAKVKRYFKERRIYYDEKGRKCEEEKYVEREVEEYFPPNPTMNIFWLKNREPKLWNVEKQGYSEADNQGGVIEIPAILEDTGMEVVDE